MHPVVQGLAHAFFAGAWRLSALRDRGATAIGERPEWLNALCMRVYRSCAERPNELAPLLELIANDEQLQAILAQPRVRGEHLQIRRWYLASDEMAEVQGPPARFKLPPIATEEVLATLVGVTITELPWFADIQRMNASRSDPRLRHYRYRWIQKPSGGMRLLEAPKPRLKAIQRIVMKELLSHCPPDDAAHGFVPGRSVLTYANVHVGKEIVLRLDLEDFFISIRGARVRAIFRRLGYPEPVARTLAGLCCTPTPEDVIRIARPKLDFQGVTRMRSTHLAQGAPTSPALSNLACFRLDRRLRGLARAAGASYTRYADDLAFSGGRDFQRAINRFIVHASAIALEEGFRVRHRKTRVMRAGDRQRLAGVVVNDRLNVTRNDYDRLRAILYNAARFGPDSQNQYGHADFRAHLLGRISWIAASNPVRGARLTHAFALIDWPP